MFELMDGNPQNAVIKVIGVGGLVAPKAWLAIGIGATPLGVGLPARPRTRARASREQGNDNRDPPSRAQCPRAPFEGIWSHAAHGVQPREHEPYQSLAPVTCQGTRKVAVDDCCPVITATRPVRLTLGASTTSNGIETSIAGSSQRSS